MLLAIDELNEAIHIYLEKGYKNEEVSIAFGAMYCDDQIDYEDLKMALSILGFSTFMEFDSLTDEQRKDILRKKYNFKKKGVM